MAISLSIPATPSAGNSPSSEQSSLPPRTPQSPDMQTLSLPAPDAAANAASQPLNNSAQMKRKPSRRANTAERRATHNAVERQRRETLNGRFLDLAALLPNLSQIRRPSKSSIVNSSIAHVHASRRHRLLASRELRNIKAESDALRRELNEWRDRAGLPRVEEPMRGDGFAMVMSGELEVLAAIPGDDEDDEANQGGYNVYDDGDDDFTGAAGNGAMLEDDDSRIPMSQANMMKNAGVNQFAHGNPSALHLAHILPRPMIAQPHNGVSYENPAMASLYEPHMQQGAHYNGGHFIEEDKAWNAQLFSAQQQQMMSNGRAYLTPPDSSHGLPAAPRSGSGNVGANPFADVNSHAFFADFQRQQQMAAMQQQQQRGHMYGSPDGDETSSVGSGRGGRERSGSLSNGSGYGSPSHGSPSGSYEMPSVLNSVAPGSAGGDYPGAPRRMNSGGLHVSTGGQWEGGMMKQSVASPISVGGGGNGNGFAMMMMM